MVKVKDTSSYGMLTAQNARRKAIVQDGMARSESIRNFASSNINKHAAMQVQTTEMQLRSNAQAAAKAKLARLTALQGKVDKLA